MFFRSPSDSRASSKRATVFSTAADSPVRAASSTARLTACVTRASAGTRSPVRSSTTSPGTRSRVGTTVSSSSRSTRADGRRHFSQRLERSPRTVFLDETEQHGEQHDDRDDDGLERVTEESGHELSRRAESGSGRSGTGPQRCAMRRHWSAPAARSARRPEGAAPPRRSRGPSTRCPGARSPRPPTGCATRDRVRNRVRSVGTMSALRRPVRL